MGLIVNDNFEPSFTTKPVLDSSMIAGGIAYVQTVSQLFAPGSIYQNAKFIKNGNLAIVRADNTPKTKESNYYRANIMDGSVNWIPASMGSGGDGGTSANTLKLVFDNEWDNSTGQGEYITNDILPDDFAYATDKDISAGWYGDSILLSLMKAINNLYKDYTILKRTVCNDFGGGDIAEASSNLLTDITEDPSYAQGQGALEVRWAEDSSYDAENTVIMTNGENIREQLYPYEELDSDGINPKDVSDGEVYLVKHMHFKFAKTYSDMKKYEHQLVKYEPVLCLENNSLYYFNGNKMVIIGTGSGEYIPSDPSSDTPDNPDEPTMAQILETLTSGQVSEIVFTDINDDSNSRKYSIGISDGNLRVTEKLGITIKPTDTAVTSSVPLMLSSTSSNPIGTLFINEVYAHSEVEEPLHDTTLPCSHNFIEIANVDPYNAIDLDDSGVNIQYHDGERWHRLELHGHINPNSTYLIRGAQVAPENAPTTVIDVSTFDIEWYEDGKLLAMNNAHGSLYLTTDPSIYNESEAATTVQGLATNPGGNLKPATGSAEVPSTYLDLFGWEPSNSTASEKTAAYEIAQFVQVGENRLYVRKYMMDRSKQAMATSLGARSNKKFMDFVDLRKNYLGNEKDFRPRASFENKNVYTTRSFFREDRPYNVSVSFGIDPTTTRCFCWISPADREEYLFYREKGSNAAWTVKKSYDKGDGQDAVLRNIKGTYENTVIESINGTQYDIYLPAYDRIKWETSGNTFVTTHKVIVKNGVTTDINGNPTPLLNELTYYTDYTLTTVSGSPTQWTKGKEYEFICGPALYDKYGKVTGPKLENCSEVQYFQVRPAVTNMKWEFIQHTDEQGFRWQEYETWRRSADVIRAQFNPQWTIDTGDMTQNGNRLSEWIDYYEGGSNLFKGGDFRKALTSNGTIFSGQSAGVEQMNVVGNNDLAPVKDYILGDGNDNFSDLNKIEGKISPMQFAYFYCYELDVDNPPVLYETVRVQPVTDNPQTVDALSVKCVIPSTYSFNYNNCHFTAICTELTSPAAVHIFNSQVNTMNDTIEAWLQKDLSKHYKNALNPQPSATYPWCICYMHEMPYTILTDTAAAKAPDAASNADARNNGCKMNDYATKRFFLSETFQNNHVRLVIGGHKHTHSHSWPLFENVTYTKNGETKFSWEMTYEELQSGEWERTVNSKQPIIMLPNTISTGVKNVFDKAFKNGTAAIDTTVDSLITRYPNNCVPYQVKAGQESTAPIYVMSQATGCKVASNKEKPTFNIPWLKYYYKTPRSGSAEASAVLGEQLYPHFVRYVFNPDTENAENPGSIEVEHYRVFKANFSNVPASQSFFPQTELVDPLATNANMTDNDNKNMTTALAETIYYTESFLKAENYEEYK